MKLVYEDENGAYMGVREEFLKNFAQKESNPNFEVYDSNDNYNRLIVGKCSRVPDDEDLTAGKFGIDFNRAKPTFREALQYRKELPLALDSLRWINNAAFAADTREEYERKSRTWDSFYSYIWERAPQIIWAVPHSGNITRPPDEIFPFPKQSIDTATAGVAASCAFNCNDKPSQRVMIAIHSANFLLTAFDIGDFGIVKEGKLTAATEKIEAMYNDKARSLVSEMKELFVLQASRWIDHIKKHRGTLNPEKLDRVSTSDRRRVLQIAKELELYGQEIKEFTTEEFNEAMRRLDVAEVKLMTCNYLFPARHVSKLLGVAEKVEQGLLHAALSFECSKVYLVKAPELMTDIILDIKNELFV
jgi:hypothetical protein